MGKQKDEKAEELQAALEHYERRIEELEAKVQRLREIVAGALAIQVD